MAATTLNCPMCGAAASSEATRCSHCNSRLATVACPSCFGMIFLGARFCSHCGARAERKEFDDTQPRPCPRCGTDTRGVVIGRTDLQECPRCEGLWADAAALQQICADQEQQAAVLGMPLVIPVTPGSSPLEKVRYLPCPVCLKLMHRVNFARCSNVIVDFCKLHGTWFDKEELRRIVEFMRAGGLEKSRANEMVELARERQRLESARDAARLSRTASHEWSGVESNGSALAAVAAALLEGVLD